jgi:hypothetical protein
MRSQKPGREQSGQIAHFFIENEAFIKMLFFD